MNKENLEGVATEQVASAKSNVALDEKVMNDSQLAAEAAAAVIKSLSPGSRLYYQGFVQGLQAAEEAKKAG